MKWQLYVIIAFAVSAAIGGLATTIMGWTMIDALNRFRPPNDQIPVALVTAKDIRWHFTNGPFPYWKILQEFHQRFPERRIYFWSIFILVWMLAMFVAAALAMISSH